MVMLVDKQMEELKDLLVEKEFEIDLQNRYIKKLKYEKYEKNVENNHLKQRNIEMERKIDVLQSKLDEIR